jgi:hypothetical protein
MPVQRRWVWWLCFGVLVLGTGCRKVEQQVDAAGAFLVFLYFGICGLQFALPRFHELPWFQRWRGYFRSWVILGAFAAFGFGLVRLSVAIRAEHYPMVQTGVALVSLCLGLWLLLWTRSEANEDQARFAKLATVSLSVLIGLFYLLHNGSKLF